MSGDGHDGSDGDSDAENQYEVDSFVAGDEESISEISSRSMSVEEVPSRSRLKKKAKGKKMTPQQLLMKQRREEDERHESRARKLAEAIEKNDRHVISEMMPGKRRREVDEDESSDPASSELSDENERAQIREKRRKKEREIQARERVLQGLDGSESESDDSIHSESDESKYEDDPIERIGDSDNSSDSAHSDSALAVQRLKLKGVKHSAKVTKLLAEHYENSPHASKLASAFTEAVQVGLINPPVLYAHTPNGRAIVEKIDKALAPLKTFVLSYIKSIAKLARDVKEMPLTSAAVSLLGSVILCFQMHVTCDVEAREDGMCALTLTPIAKGDNIHLLTLGRVAKNAPGGLEIYHLPLATKAPLSTLTRFLPTESRPADPKPPSVSRSMQPTDGPDNADEEDSEDDSSSLFSSDEDDPMDTESTPVSPVERLPTELRDSALAKDLVEGKREISLVNTKAFMYWLSLCDNFSSEFLSSFSDGDKPRRGFDKSGCVAIDKVFGAMTSHTLVPFSLSVLRVIRPKKKGKTTPTAKNGDLELTLRVRADASETVCQAIRKLDPVKLIKTLALVHDTPLAKPVKDVLEQKKKELCDPAAHIFYRAKENVKHDDVATLKNIEAYKHRGKFRGELANYPARFFASLLVSDE